MTDERNNKRNDGMDEPDFDEVVLESLLKAHKAFEENITDYGYDPAYADVRFTAWVLDANLTSRLRRFEIEGEVKDSQK